jgi:hypothetical protein
LRRRRQGVDELVRANEGGMADASRSTCGEVTKP